MIVSKLFNQFFHSQTSGGILLIFCTAFSLLLANSPIAEFYDAIWLTDMFGHSFAHWINDGLMAIFFFLIGLELKREVFVGELSDTKKAILPVFAALGGMLIPAFILLLLL